MWYLESWLWEQISWLKTGDWNCSLIMHGGRLELGEQVGWLQAYKWGVSMLEIFSLCRDCGRVTGLSGQLWLQNQESVLHWSGVLFLVLRVLRAQLEELRTMSQENASPSHGQFDKLKTIKSRGTEQLEDCVPGKCMALTQRIFAFKMSPKPCDYCQLHLCR